MRLRTVKRSAAGEIGHSATDLVLGLTALAAITVVCFQLGASVATTAFAYLVFITLLSVRGRFLPMAALSLVAVESLHIVIAPPAFSVRIADPHDLIIIGAFATTALVVTGLVATSRGLRDELRLVVDTIPVIAWSASPDGAAEFLNQRFRELTGFSTAEGTGWEWMTALHPDDRDERPWRAAFGAGEPFEREARLRHADGTYRWFVLRAVPLRDDRGRIVRWYGTGTDIDERKRAEGVLREQARLLDLSHDSVFVRDMNDVVTYWNRGAEELYGWTSDEAIGQVTHRLLRTRFPAPLHAITATLLRDRRWDGELVHTKRDGTEVIVSSRWALETDDGGNAIAVLETNNDVTERKRAEEALRQQADLLEQAHDAIFVWDFPGAIVYWNRGAEQLYGFTKDEAIGQIAHELLRTRYPVPTAEFDAMLKRDRTWTGEVTQTTRDGRDVVVDSRHVMIDAADGRRFVLETNRDVTDRKRAEYLTEQVFVSSPDSIGIVGRDYRYQRVNPVYARYARVPAADLVGMDVRDHLDRDIGTESTPYFDRCLAGEELTYTGWMEGPGGPRYMAATLSPLRPQGDRVEAVLVISRDLTEHLVATDALREAQAALAHVTRVATLGEVTASIAHEVNQPLAAIVNNANACLGLLRDGHVDVTELREALADIASDGERASAIVERVRRLAKRSPPAYAPVRLDELVRDVVELARPDAIARGVTIRVDIPRDLPVVRGDRVQLQQVLLNLVVNAMDAMTVVADRERLVEIDARAESPDGNPAVRLTVRDRGVGLDVEHIARLFDAFYTTKPTGMGMGLAISRSIVDAHGGRLGAEPNDGPGATFWFTVPAADGS